MFPSTANSDVVKAFSSYDPRQIVSNACPISFKLVARHDKLKFVGHRYDIIAPHSKAAYENKCSGGADGLSETSNAQANKPRDIAEQNQK